MLPISMLAGAAMYLTYHFMPEPVHRAGPALEHIVALAQPLMIFTMLFLTFCRIEPHELKPHRWHCWLLLIQGGSFTLIGLAIFLLSRLCLDSLPWCKVLMESAMLCLICPTATAAAVVTRKLGGDVPGITTYTILINILTAILVPAIVPLIQPMGDFSFRDAFCRILAKVFPLLIMPCLAGALPLPFPAPGYSLKTGSGIRYLGGFTFPCDCRYRQVNSPQHYAGLPYAAHRPGVPGVLRFAVRPRAQDRKFLWQAGYEHHCRTGTGPEEHGLCDMDGLHLHDPGDIHCGRNIQHLA